MTFMNTHLPFFRHLGHTLRRAIVLPALLMPGFGLVAQGLTQPQQLIDATQLFLEDAVQEYLQRTEIDGRHEVTVNRLDPRLRLAACDLPITAALESPAQPIGRVTVRVSCEGAAPWKVFVPGQVRLFRDVVVAARPLKRLQTLGAADVALAERDVGLLTQGYLTGMPQAIGYKMTRTTLPDQVLTPAHVELADVVQRGDQVIITAESGPIAVRMPGEALASGAAGQQIRVRNLGSKRVVKARVIGPGQVVVAM